MSGSVNLILAAFLAGLTIGAVVGWNGQGAIMRAEALKYGPALYCPRTGEFAFDFSQCKEPKP